jgi:hypothetical protein
MSFSPPSTPKEESGLKKAEIREEEPMRSRSRGIMPAEQGYLILKWWMFYSQFIYSFSTFSIKSNHWTINCFRDWATWPIGEGIYWPSPEKIGTTNGARKTSNGKVESGRRNDIHLNLPHSRGLLEAISLPPEDPLRLEHFRLFARIYGRFDAKRRPDKALTRHERIVNEAAAQLSLLRADLLARRDILFPLARKV